MKKHVATFALVAMLSSCNVTGKPGAQAFECRVPPARFDHEPARPYNVIVDPYLRGNAFTSNDRSTIILPGQSSARWQACFLRHEKGHVNGWDAGHGGERRTKY